MADHPVTNPAHYQGAGGIMSVDVTESYGLNHRLSAAVEYVLRHDKKGHPDQDLCKALWWITRELCARRVSDDALASVQASIATWMDGQK